LKAFANKKLEEREVHKRQKRKILSNFRVYIR
jgi:hypothetical protein